MTQVSKLNQHGVTLIELIISIVVISIVSTTIIRLSSSLTAQSADPMISYQAVAIAESYLAEILAKSYTDPDTGTVCPAAEASRAQYDNVCDYDGFSDTGVRTITAPSTVLTGMSDYTVTVDIVTNDTLNGLSGPTEILRIDVTVQHTTTDILSNGYTLSGYRANF